MRKQILVLILIGVFNLGIAQELRKSEVPSVVLNQFTIQFPKAKDVEWKKTNGLYKVEFEYPNNIDHDLWYNPKGEVFKHKEEIPKKNLPQSIKSKIAKDFPAFRIDDVSKITEEKSSVFVVEIENGKIEKKLYFKEDGTQIVK